jgi:hypothetical protein
LKTASIDRKAAQMPMDLAWQACLETVSIVFLRTGKIENRRRRKDVQETTFDLGSPGSGNWAVRDCFSRSRANGEAVREPGSLTQRPAADLRDRGRPRTALTTQALEGRLIARRRGKTLSGDRAPRLSL